VLRVVAAQPVNDPEVWNVDSIRESLHRVLVYVNPITLKPTNIELCPTTLPTLIERGQYMNCAWVPDGPSIVHLPTYNVSPRI
jgi:hypothetical protein